jgi:hypothetical protein
MATLDMSSPDELRLTLRGPDENAILTTLRRWPHWLRADVERDPDNSAQVIAVTLIADRNQEATLREILRRSFGMTFPPDGGDFAFTPPPAPSPMRRGPMARRG